MAFCKNCGNLFDWGYDTGADRWIPLEPVATHSDLEKSFVDDSGTLRADHRDRCRGRTVHITRLDCKIPPDVVEEEEVKVVEVPTEKPKKKRRLRIKQPRSVLGKWLRDAEEEAALAAEGKDVYGSLQ